MIISSLLRFFREYGKSPLAIEIDRVSRALKRHENELFDMQDVYSHEEDNYVADDLDWAIYQKQKKIERVSSRLAQLKEKRWRNNSSRT